MEVISSPAHDEGRPAEHRRVCGGGRGHLPPAEFGPTLTRAKVESGLSYRQLAAATGVSRGHLHSMCQGVCSPSPTVAAALVAYFGLSGVDAAVVMLAAVPGAGRDHPAVIRRNDAREARRRAWAAVRESAQMPRAYEGQGEPSDRTSEAAPPASENGPMLGNRR